MLQTRQYFGITAANGTCTVTIQAKQRQQIWNVQQLSAELPGAPVGSTCVLRHNGRLVTPLVATGDVAAGDPPIPLQGVSDTMQVIWTGCPAGAQGLVWIVYDDGT